MKQNNNKIFTVYRHVNRFNGGVYVGVTSMKPEYRWNNGKGYMRNELFFNEIMFYGWDNFDHEILARTTKKEVADLLEREFIKVYTTLGVSYNIQSGGYEGFKEADSTRQKISKALSGEKSYWYGKHLSAETRKKLSEANSKKVAQIDRKDGHIIKIWDGLSEATKETGIANQNISAACRGKRNYAGGYKWRYV